MHYFSLPIFALLQSPSQAEKGPIVRYVRKNNVIDIGESVELLASNSIALESATGGRHEEHPLTVQDLIFEYMKDSYALQASLALMLRKMEYDYDKNVFLPRTVPTNEAVQKCFTTSFSALILLNITQITHYSLEMGVKRLWKTVLKESIIGCTYPARIFITSITFDCQETGGEHVGTKVWEDGIVGFTNPMTFIQLERLE